MLVVLLSVFVGMQVMKIEYRSASFFSERAVLLFFLQLVAYTVALAFYAVYAVFSLRPSLNLPRELLGLHILF